MVVITRKANNVNCIFVDSVDVGQYTFPRMPQTAVTTGAVFLILSSLLVAVDCTGSEADKLAYVHFLKPSHPTPQAGYQVKSMAGVVE